MGQAVERARPMLLANIRRMTTTMAQAPSNAKDFQRILSDLPPSAVVTLTSHGLGEIFGVPPRVARTIIDRMKLLTDNGETEIDIIRRLNPPKHGCGE